MKTSSKKEDDMEDGWTQEIRLSLDSYQDLFSDFDPRPLTEKALSEDFLSEVRKASMDKEAGRVKLVLLVPKKLRNKVDELGMEKRLKEHFSKHYHIHRKEKSWTIKQGFVYLLIGIAMMFTATVLLFEYERNTILTSFMTVLLEPAGWFMFWEGMAFMLFDWRKINPNLEFYEKMAKSSISFDNA